MNDNLLKQIDVPIITEGELRRSAVAIALTENEDVILEVRSEKIDRQPGDICLPGGRLEGDETPEQAAAKGRKAGVEAGIKKLVKVCIELGVNKEVVEEKLMEEYSLSQEEAQRKVDMYTPKVA